MQNQCEVSELVPTNAKFLIFKSLSPTYRYLVY